MKTVLRYAGGKSRAIKHITPFVENYDKIVSHLSVIGKNRTEKN